jgi:hypothetical protein
LGNTNGSDPGIGIAIVDFNFGGHSNDKAYKDEGTRVWYTVAKLIKGGRIAAPDRHHETVKKLFAQLTSRRQKAHSSGCLWMESKAEMASRGVKSPDVADAFVIAFGVQSAISFSWMPYDGSGRAEIARSHGWTYTEDSGGSNEDSVGLSAFGCHSKW